MTPIDIGTIFSLNTCINILELEHNILVMTSGTQSYPRLLITYIRYRLNSWINRSQYYFVHEKSWSSTGSKPSPFKQGRPL